MKKTGLLFLGFLALFIIGGVSCLPGICGNAFSIWPSRWEDSIALPALTVAIVGLSGMFICCTIWLIRWTRNKTIADTTSIRAQQEANRDQK